MNLFSSSKSSATTQQAIDTPPLGVTTVAQLSGAITAVGAAVVAILPTILGVDTTDALKIALIGLVGAGILAWAIAAAGDTLARAYAAAHVTRTPSDQDNQPALQTAAIRLADAYAAAHGLKISAQASPANGGASTSTASVYAPAAPAASKETRLPISPPLKVKRGAQDGEAVAVLVSGESGKETQRYLVGFPGSPPSWVTSDAIYVPPAAPPVTSPVTSPAAQLPSTAASEDGYLALSPPIKVKVGANDGEAIAVQVKREGGKETQRYLVGTPGNTYKWVVEDTVSMPPMPRPAPPFAPPDAPSTPSDAPSDGFSDAPSDAPPLSQPSSTNPAT
jgi:hypothetical protein